MRSHLVLFMFFLISICVSSLTIQLSEADVREQMGLVAFWTFDQGTIQNIRVDDVFGKNSGTITGKPNIIEGAVGKALQFDGAVDLIRMNDDIFFPSVSMEATIKPALGRRCPIYDKYNYGIQTIDSNQVGIWIRAETADQAKQWPSAYTPFPNDGQWHHVVGVVEDSKSVKIYLDGILKSTTPAPDPISIVYGAQVKPTIAYTQHLNGIWYKGDIDEVAIYKGALSDTDVKKLYSATLAVQSSGKLAVTWGMIK